MYGNNYNNNNNNYGASSWNNNQNSNWNNQPMQQQNWGSAPGSPRVNPPMMGGMGMGGGMPNMELGMGMAPPRKQYSDPSQYNSGPMVNKPYNQYGNDNLDVNSAKMGMNNNMGGGMGMGMGGMGMNNNMGMGMNNNMGMGMGYNNGGYNQDMMMNRQNSMMAMTSLAYRTAAYSMPMAPDARGDTQFSGVAPETYNAFNAAGGGMKTGEYVDHQGAAAQYLRDAVLGINDGLVSMLLLTLGLAGGGLGATQVLLAGISGAAGGAISMALGEYIATKSQSQVTASEIKLEREHLQQNREKEIQEVRTFMQELNLEGELLEKCVAAINSRDEAMIRLMMAFEFGFQEELERSPLKAMLTSGALFLTGSLPSVLPYAVTTNVNTALFISLAFGVVCLFGIGAGKCYITKGVWWYDGTENLILGSIGGAATFGLGKAYGTGKTTMV